MRPLRGFTKNSPITMEALTKVPTMNLHHGAAPRDLLSYLNANHSEGTAWFRCEVGLPLTFKLKDILVLAAEADDTLICMEVVTAQDKDNCFEAMCRIKAHLYDPN